MGDSDEPLEWILLTTLPVGNRAGAGRILDSYRLRWRIKDWHQVLKSGCRTEFLNLEAAERLPRAITIKAVIAWRLLAMLMMGRETPKLPPEVLFSDLEIRILKDVARGCKRPPPDHLGNFLQIMTMLGGYRNRKQDGPPDTKSSGPGMPPWATTARPMNGWKDSIPVSPKHWHRNDFIPICVQTRRMARAC